MVHRPQLGDTKVEHIKLNGINIYRKVHGKSVNKYSGKYQGYHKINDENDRSEAVDSTIDAIKEIEIDLGIKIFKNHRALADRIVEVSYYNEDSFNIRKSKEYLGCKVVVKY